MIEVSHLSKKYRKKTVLKDISFHASTGQYVVITGTNGCGKSTLLKILSGSLSADSGTISYFNHIIEKSGKSARKYCGYVPQGNPLMEELSVKDNLRLWENHKGSSSKIIKEFSMEDMLNTKVSKLSGGMKRRLSIACAFVNLPPILLLDEPTSALDLHYKSMIWSWLDDYISSEGTVIVVSHEPDEIMRADKRYFMKDGTLTELSTDISMKDITNMINGG